MSCAQDAPMSGISLFVESADLAIPSRCSLHSLASPAASPRVDSQAAARRGVAQARPADLLPPPRVNFGSARSSGIRTHNQSVRSAPHMITLSEHGAQGCPPTALLVLTTFSGTNGALAT